MMMCVHHYCFALRSANYQTITKGGDFLCPLVPRRESFRFFRIV